MTARGGGLAAGHGDRARAHRGRDGYPEQQPRPAPCAPDPGRRPPGPQPGPTRRAGLAGRGSVTRRAGLLGWGSVTRRAGLLGWGSAVRRAGLLGRGSVTRRAGPGRRAGPAAAGGAGEWGRSGRRALHLGLTWCAARYRRRPRRRTGPGHRHGPGPDGWRRPAAATRRARRRRSGPRRAGNPSAPNVSPSAVRRRDAPQCRLSSWLVPRACSVRPSPRPVGSVIPNPAPPRTPRPAAGRYPPASAHPPGHPAGR